MLTGSHIDTVAHRRPLRRHPRCARRARGDRDRRSPSGIELEHPLAVAFFTDEEGSRFAPDMLGSLVYRRRDAARGGARRSPAIDGAVARRRARAHRLRGPGAVPGARRRTRTSSCTSSRARCSRPRASTIGVVTGVQGISWTELTVTGQSNHAGTTPMTMRHDAGYVAAEIAVFVRALAGELGAAAGRDGRAHRAAPEPGERGRRARDAHRRPAQHRRRRARARPSAGCSSSCDELARRRGCDDRRAVRSRASSRSTSTTA